MEELQKFRRILIGRIIASVVFYAVFIAMAVLSLVTNHPDLQWGLVVPFVIAILVMPRRATPRGEEAPEDDEERLEVWHKLERTTTWLQGVRFAYIGIAIVLLLIIPEIIYA